MITTTLTPTETPLAAAAPTAHTGSECENVHPRVLPHGKHGSHGRLGLAVLSLALAITAIVPTAVQAQGQCTRIATGLRSPVGTVLTDHGNVLIAESGDGTPDSGRISIVDRNGNVRTLLDGMPSAPADVGTPSGPTGLYMRGRDLIVAMGIGDVGIMGPYPGTTLANPNGPSSPIFSSVLEMLVTGKAENSTTGFSMSPADQDTLAQGRWVTLRDAQGNFLFMHMVANLPDYVPYPIPGVPDNIHGSNPFGIVGLGLSFYINDGGRNLTWKVNRLTGESSEFASYPDIPNPLFGQVGGPFIQAVPTGINIVGHQLLVSRFTGAPFATGVSTLEMLDPATGTHAPLISGLTTAIDTASTRRSRRHDDLLVLEYSSAGPFFQGPGTVLRYDDPDAVPTTVADCLSFPTSMTLNKWNNTLYVTEEEGNLVTIPLQ